jgi:DNA polymerase III alpha subunit
MNEFKITGNVEKVEQKKSQAGKDYVTFQVKEGTDVFDLSLFGDNVAMQSKLKGKVSITGVLKSREYNGKNYPDFRVSWIDGIDVKAARQVDLPKAPDDIDSLPF